MKTTQTNTDMILNSLINQIDAKLVYWDKELMCKFANNAYANWYGLQVEDIVNKMTLPDLLGDDLFENNKVYVDQVLQGNLQKFERKFKTSDGVVKHSLVTYHPHWVDGKVDGFFGHGTDISHLKNLELELSGIETRFNNFLNSAPDAIVIVDSEGTIQFINKETTNLLGYLPDEVLKQKVEILIPDQFKANHTHHRNGFISYPKTREMGSGLELFAKHKSGKNIPVEISISPIQEGEKMYVSASIRDITKRKETERALQESNNFNKIFIEQSALAVAMFDTNIRYLSASQKWKQDYKIEHIELIGKTHYEVFPEIGDDWKQIHQDCLKGAINTCDESIFERADGSTQWIRWDVRPWYKSETEIGGLLMFTEDITPLKTRDSERRRIEDILEKSSQVAKICTWEVDAITEAYRMNSMGYEIFDFDPKDNITYRDLFKLFKPGERLDKFLQSIKTASETGQSYDLELELITAKGKHKWIRIIGEAELKNGVCVRRFGIFQDISKLKESEIELNILNEELKAVLNSSNVSIISTDTNGLIKYFNSGAEKMLGYSADEMVNLSTPDIIHKLDEVVLRGQELTEKYNKKIEGFDVFVEQAKHGIYESKEWTYVSKSNKEFPVQLAVSAIKNNANQIIGFIGVATDISEIKEAESKLKSVLEITTAQNNRLKNFAHIVSHNLRSHAGNIEMILNLLIHEHNEMSENEYVQLLKTGSFNLMETIGNLNEVAEINTSEINNLTSINLKNSTDKVVHSIIQLAKEADTEIINNIDPKINVLGLHAYVDSILLNFITNGIKYRDPSKKAQVNLTACIKHNYCILEVTDNGLGIDLKKYGGKLFGLYKTFHGNDDAKGIGLFISKNQIEAMGGKIEVTSTPKLGTTFTLYFKIAN